MTGDRRGSGRLETPGRKVPGVAQRRAAAAGGRPPSGRLGWAGGEGRAPSAREGGTKARPGPQVGGRGRDGGAGRRHSAWPPPGGRAEARRGAAGARQEQRDQPNRDQAGGTGAGRASPTRLGPVAPVPAPRAPANQAAPPAARPRGPSPSRRGASQWAAEPGPPVRAARADRLRARKANPTRRGCRSGPAAATAVATSSPRIGCTVPTRKSSFAARQRRTSAMTQEYDK